MRISLSKYCKRDNEGAFKVYVRVSVSDDPPQSELIESHSFNLQECLTNQPIAIEVFITKPQSRQLRNYGKILFGVLFSKDESSIARQRLQQMIPPHPTGRVLLELNGDLELDVIPWEYAWVGDPVIPPYDPHASFPDLHLSDQFHNFVNSHYANTRKVILERVFPPTVDRMEALLMNKPQTATALHFMGHCGKNGDARSLIFEQGENGKPDFVDTSHLLSVPKHLRLAFLSACDTRDVARVMCEHGVPYTIGSYCSLPDDLTRIFESKFYQFLAGGFTVEMAMWRARVFLKDHNDVRRRDYFSGAMVLYSSTFWKDDSAFECEEGKPTVQLHMPPNNLESIQTMATFCGRKKELVELNCALRHMASRRKQSCGMYTIEGTNGVGKTALAMEAIRRTAYLFPGGIFAWTFDHVPKLGDYFERLVEVIFADGREPLSRDIRSAGGDIARWGTDIIKAFEAKPACLLFLDHSDTLKREAAQNNPDAKKLWQWIQRIASTSDIAVKILATSNEPLRCMGEKTMHLDGLIDSDIVNGVKLFVGNVDAEIRERMNKEANAEQLMQSLVTILNGHPLCLRFLGSAVNLPQYRNASLQEFDPEHCSIMLADQTRGSQSLGKCFASMIGTLPTNQRILLYMCSLFIGPITEGILEFICYFVENTGSSSERVGSSVKNRLRDLQQLCDSGLLSKKDGEYRIHVGLREGARQCNAELKLRFRLPIPGLYNGTFVIGVVEPSIRGISTMLEWQLRNLQTNDNNQMKNKSFGIRYYYIGNTGLHIADIPGLNNHSHETAASLQQSSFHRLVVFTYKTSDGAHNSLPQFCREQIVPMVLEKKLPFILYFDNTDAKLSEAPAMTTPVLMKKTADALRASLEKTHRIIMTDCLSDPIGRLSTVNNSSEGGAAILNADPISAIPIDKKTLESKTAKISVLKDLVDVHMKGKFVGRECELRKLDKLLNDNNIRYITIRGFGGIGKTSLALQAARNFSSGSVLALSLVGTTSSSQVILKIARFLNIDVKNLDPQDQQSEVLRNLEREEVILLYLDNIEDVKLAIENGDPEKQKDAKTLMRFLQLLPINVKILAASRIALNWPDEELVELDGLTPHDGMQVFRQWISYRKNDVDNDDAMNLSCLVHGHPLSLLLLGGVFKNSREPIKQFIHNIHDRLLEATDLCPINERHRSTNICIQYNFKYLDISFRSLLRQLKVLEVPFTSTIVTRILDHDTTSPPSLSMADNLHRLWQHSWLNRCIYKDDPILGDWRPRIVENDTEFYYLHPRIREFLNDQLDCVDGDMPNDADIQFYKALCYGVGFGVVSDLEKLIEWCTKAATNGHLEAQLTVAFCYEEGVGGIGKDEKAAFEWYLMAAEAGDRGAQEKIETWYLLRNCVDWDFGKWTYWKGRAESNTTKPLEIKFDLTLPLLHRAAACDQATLIRSLMEKSLTKDVIDRYGRTPLHAAAEKGCIDTFELLAFEFYVDTNVKDKTGATPLHQAAQGGHVEIARLLVAEFGAGVNNKTDNGWTSLHHAAAGGHVDVVRLLVAELGADLNATDKNGWIPLQQAILFRHVDVVRLLVAELGANVNTKDNNGETPLHLASRLQHVEIVKSLVTELGAHVNAKTWRGWTPLHQTVAGGNVEIVRLFVAELGVDVNAKNYGGQTPLHLATEFQHIEVVRFLAAELGVDINAKDNEEQTPLHLASKLQHVDIVRLLAATFGVDINAKDKQGWTPLHQAAAGGHVEVVKLLVAEYGADTNAKDKGGGTPLHRAAAGRHVQIVRLFINEFGAGVNTKDNDGRTLLHRAAKWGHIEVVKSLLTEFGADANAKDYYGWTPLNDAIFYRHVPVVRLLMTELGTDANAKTLLHSAAADGRVDIVRLLVTQLGVDVNAKDNNKRTPLHKAISFRHVDAVRVLVTEFGADVNAKDKVGLTPLHLAVAGSHVEVVRLLIAELGADVNCKDDTERTPLHLASLLQHVGIAKLLMSEFRADTHAKDNAGRTPLHQAIFIQHVEGARLLVAEFGADANAKDNRGWTPLHLATVGGHVDGARLLVAELEADANARDNYGWTPLHLAVADSHVDIMRLLVAELGADVNAKDNGGQTPLHLASRSQHIEVVRLLVAELGADVNTKGNDGQTPLHLASRLQHVEVVRLLVAKFSADTNAKDQADWTPLHQAAAGGYVEVVRLLVVEFGAEVNAKDKQGWTPLHQAAAGGHVEVVRLLVAEFGVDVNTKDNCGWTALHQATAGEHVDVMRLLVSEFEVDSNAKNNHGWTPLHQAAVGGHAEVMRLLVAEFRVDPNVKNNHGWTPLHQAAASGHVEIVRLLVARFGADANNKTDYGWTPLHHAAVSGHVDVVRLLVAELGADLNAKDNNGRTPLHLTNLFRNVDVVRMLASEFQAGKTDAADVSL